MNIPLAEPGEIDGRPCIGMAGRTYDSLQGLIAAYPALADDLIDYCSLLLHFYPDSGCIPITSTESFRTRYRELMQPPAKKGIPPEMIPPPPDTHGTHETIPAPPLAVPPASLAPQAGRTRALGSHPEIDNTVPTDFGPYDLSEIALPRVDGGKLVFYAEQTLYGIPYRVEAPWPAGSEGEVSFLLLPSAGHADEN